MTPSRRLAIFMTLPLLALLPASCATTRSASDQGEPLDACEALRSPGFEDVMERALRRGLVERVAQASSDGLALVPGRLYAQAAVMMWAYQLTQRAVEQGVPQRVGHVVGAGCTAAFMAIWHLVRRGPSEAERASAEQAAPEAAAPRAGPSGPAQEGPSPIPRVTGSDRRPPRRDCRENYVRCALTGLGSPNPNTPGKTSCGACFERCVGQRLWPDRLDNGIDCQFWNYQ